MVKTLFLMVLTTARRVVELQTFFVRSCTVQQGMHSLLTCLNLLPRWRSCFTHCLRSWSYGASQECWALMVRIGFCAMSGPHVIIYIRMQAHLSSAICLYHTLYDKWFGPSTRPYLTIWLASWGSRLMKSMPWLFFFCEMLTGSFQMLQRLHVGYLWFLSTIISR